MSATLDFIRAGETVENEYMVIFNSSLRKEYLSVHWFESLGDARRIIETWRVEQNRDRPHGSLGDQSPQDFPRALRAQHPAADAEFLTV